MQLLRKAHNVFTVAQDIAAVAPFDTLANIFQFSPDKGPAAVWFPPDGGHAVRPQLRHGMADASHMDQVMQRAENIVEHIGATVKEATQRIEASWSQWGEDTWSQWDRQQWGAHSWSQWEGQQDWQQ